MMIAIAQADSIWNVGIKTAAAQNMIALDFIEKQLGLFNDSQTVYLHHKLAICLTHGKDTAGTRSTNENNIQYLCF